MEKDGLSSIENSLVSTKFYIITMFIQNKVFILKFKMYFFIKVSIKLQYVKRTYKNIINDCVCIILIQR